MVKYGLIAIAFVALLGMIFTVTGAVYAIILAGGVGSAEAASSGGIGVIRGGT